MRNDVNKRMGKGDAMMRNGISRVRMEDVWLDK